MIKPTAFELISMVTLALMQHFTFQHGRRTAITRAVPLALSLGIGSLGMLALSPTPVAAQSGSTSRSLTVLDEGDQGELVVRLQQRLAELGFFSSEATGFYGPLTEEAVMRYQTAQGLIADGIAGPETLGTLLPRSVASSTPPRASQQLDNRELQSVQTQLSRLGFYLGEVDGVYGPQTEAALNSFQSIYALPITGITDPLTLETLARVYSQAGDRPTVANQIPSQPAIGASASFDSATASQVSFGSGQNFSSTATQTQISTTRINLPPAIPSGPTVAANIPQTTRISSPLPPPPLPNRQASFSTGNFNNPNLNDAAFNSGTFNNPDFNPSLSSRSNNFPSNRQTFTAAPAVVGFPYVVAVPVKTGATLAEVRRTVASAFLEDSKRGTYIQAGAYNSREEAERATQALRDRRLDARVIYRPE